MWSPNENVESKMGKCGVQLLTYLLFDPYNDKHIMVVTMVALFYFALWQVLLIYGIYQTLLYYLRN